MSKANPSNQVAGYNANTPIGVIEKKYGVSLEVRSDMKLANYLKKIGFPSLSKMLKNA